MLINKEAYKHYIESFNTNDEDVHPVLIPNAASWKWIEENVPFLDCPDKTLEQTYYFRWWTYRKHIKPTPYGYIIDEFLPNVPWAGNYNSINGSAPHHIYEGRWLKKANEYLDNYSRFWYRYSTEPRMYSSWLEDSIVNYCKVTGNNSLACELLPEMVENYRLWEKEHLNASGLFWSNDGYDAMEYSISGSGIRPTLNSYMYANALAIAETAKSAGNTALEQEYLSKAAWLKNSVQEKLWDPKDEFFKVHPLEAVTDTVGDWAFDAVPADNNVREEIGYIPWCFNLPDEGYENAWKQIMDEEGFFAPYGPTTAERRHPRFMYKHDEHECLWNGPSWPFSTCQTLHAMANLLNNYHQDTVTKKDFYELLMVYTRCHFLSRKDGTTVSWIDENIQPFTGRWLARDILESWNWREDKGGYERGKDYNHSTFCDLIISDLIGIKPRADNVVEIAPLIPENTWEYFCLEDVPYHGHSLTVFFDADGSRYGRGKGLHLFVDGKECTSASKLTKISAAL